MIYLDLDVARDLSVTSRNHKNSIQYTVWPSVVVIFFSSKLRSGHVDDHGEIRHCTIKTNISTKTHPIAVHLELLCCHLCRGSINLPHTVSPFVFCDKKVFLIALIKKIPLSMSRI